MKMKENGFYGVVGVKKDVFDKLNPEFFISQSNEITKFMCANSSQHKHLESLGIDVGGVVCDWFKINLVG